MLQLAQLVRQLNRGFHPHFFKNIGPVKFHGALGDAQVLGNIFVVVTAQQLIEHFFMEQQVQMELLIPFAQGRLLTELHELHAVRETDYCETGTRVKVSLPASKRARFKPYEIHKK